MQFWNFLYINFRFDSIELNYFNETEVETEVDQRSTTASNKRNEGNISVQWSFSQLEQKFREFSKFGKITKAWIGVKLKIPFYLLCLAGTLVTQEVAGSNTLSDKKYLANIVDSLQFN